MSRLSNITTDGESTANAAHTYLGADTVVTEDYQQAQVKLDYTANNLSGMDQFGRVQQQFWSSYGAASGNAGTMDGVSYVYDADGNRTNQNNAKNSSLNEIYVYDKLNRLTSATRADGHKQSGVETGTGLVFEGW